MPNDGERSRNGETIATGFVESTVNEVVSKRFCKTQQMPWSKEGAHWLLQTRVRTLNGELGAIFKRWYPDMDIEAKERPAAASSPASPCSRHEWPVDHPCVVWCTPATVPLPLLTLLRLASALHLPARRDPIVTRPLPVSRGMAPPDLDGAMESILCRESPI